MKPMISEILESCSKLKTRNEKIEFLKHHSPNLALRHILKFMFHPDIKFLLPEGIPPYKPCQIPNQEGRLYQEVRKLYLFVDGGNPDLKQVKRESMFIQLLESVDPKEAKVLLCMKDKKSPYVGITRKLVEEAYGSNY